MRDHTADSTLDEKLGMALAAGGESLGLVATDVTGEAHVSLLHVFFATDANLVGIDDDDEITRINMRGENSFALAAQKVGGLHGHMAEMLVSSVDDPPIALDLARFCRKCLHLVLKRIGEHAQGCPFCQMQRIFIFP